MDIALVTGTSRGLGEAVAKALLERGWQVVGFARGGAPLNHEHYRHATLDLSDPAGVAAWLRTQGGALLGEGDGCVGLVNNAGTLAPIATVPDVDGPVMAAGLALGVVAPVQLMGFVLRAAPRRRVRIVNVSSGAASQPISGWAAYCGGKAALEMTGRVLAVELEEVEALGNRDVAIVSSAPGILDTAMQADIRAAPASHFPQVERFGGYHAEGRLADPARPAAEIVALLEAGDLPRFSERSFSP